MLNKIFIACFTLFFAHAGASQSILFTMKGSNTIGENLAPALAKAYLDDIGAQRIDIFSLGKPNEKQVTGYKNGNPLSINIHAHGSSTGFKSLRNKQTDIALSSRRIKPKEASSLSSMGDLTSFDSEKIIAIDGLAIIVHPNNPINTLSIDDVAALFSDKKTTWQSVGGRDAPVNLYARDDNSGTWDTFKNLVLRKKYRLSGQAQRFESNDLLSEKVSQDINAIGFVSLASINNSRALAISDQQSPALLPSHQTVATEDYLLSRRLYMYVPAINGNQLINHFINFVQGTRGQKIVSQIGFISQNPTRAPVKHIKEGPEHYLQLVKTSERVSINFRFSKGSAQLDNKAKQDIKRLVDYLKSLNLKQMKIKLVGFGDKKQRESRSLILSKLRATAVKSALHKHGINTEPVIGFGSDLPVSSNNNEGKHKNQRVEIWITKI